MLFCISLIICSLCVISSLAETSYAVIVSISSLARFTSFSCWFSLVSHSYFAIEFSFLKWLAASSRFWIYFLFKASDWIKLFSFCERLSSSYLELVNSFSYLSFSSISFLLSSIYIDFSSIKVWIDSFVFFNSSTISAFYFSSALL